jgi:hypothetical protein
MRFLKFVIPFTLLVFFAACEEKSFNPRVPEGPDFSLTPMEDEEAEVLAMYLSGEIMAPLELYDTIKSDLLLIRNTWADSVPDVLIRYLPYPPPSEIYIGLTPQTFESIRLGEYHEWDSLNIHYRLDSVELLSQFGAVKLHFNGRLNANLLVDAYAGLPGFRYIHTEAFVGDWSTLLASKDESVIKYFFRFGFGDCPSGCIYSRLTYLTREEDSAYFHGQYLTNYPPDSSRPTWVDTAIIAFRNYHTLNFWRAE